MVLSLTTPFTTLFTSPVISAVHQWSAASQQQARRNAMVATNTLLRRRIERDEVLAYLAARRGERVYETFNAPVADHG